MLLDNSELANYEEVMMRSDSGKWREAMESKIESIYKNQVWTLVDLPNSCKEAECK